MSYKKTLDNIASELESIMQLAAAFKIPTEDFGWVNKRYVGENFRMAHIERYSDKNLEVLHLLVFQILHFSILSLGLISLQPIKNHWQHLWIGVLLIIKLV